MLFHLSYRSLTLDDLEGHRYVKKVKKILFLPRSRKLYILVVYRFLIKNKLWIQSVHFWSCDITKHGIYDKEPLTLLDESKHPLWCGTLSLVWSQVRCLHSNPNLRVYTLTQPLALDPAPP